MYLLKILCIFCSLILIIVACTNKNTKGKQGQHPSFGTTQDTILQHDRLIPLEGAYNFRDLGGYPAENGKRVKWGKVFRSDDLDKLTSKDLDYLASLPLKTNIDFRSEEERKAAPDKNPVSVKKYITLTISPGNIMDMQKIKGGQAEQFMIDVNKLLVRDYQKSFTEFFEILMDTANAPLLFHCSAGKDRTGFAAALFLSSLGVDREIIMQDYLLSAQNVAQKYAPMVKAHPEFAAFMTVKPEYLQAAFDVIDQEYGGMENYLSKHLKVDLKKIQSLYTE